MQQKKHKNWGQGNPGGTQHTRWIGMDEPLVRSCACRRVTASRRPHMRGTLALEWGEGAIVGGVCGAVACAVWLVGGPLLGSLVALVCCASIGARTVRALR